jgi:hypothetical protein
MYSELGLSIIINASNKDVKVSITLPKLIKNSKTETKFLHTTFNAKVETSLTN